MKNIGIILLAFLVLFNCNQRSATSGEGGRLVDEKSKVEVGADQLDILLPKLTNKSVALVVNHTSLVGNTHLADTLMASGDGEKISDGVDSRTGLPIVSLYGANRKPTPEQLADVDVVIFDIQDVGTRFYTYISTMHYVMEACAEQGKKLVILDRPNPNGHYVDGPIRTPALKSFVGMHPIPIVHGLTVGELSGMINGEGWLENGVKCDVDVIRIKNWGHNDFYSVPVKPSPNLPNDQAIRLYPSLCLFEGTVISVGRGTQTPFLIIGNPEFTDLSFSFTPVAIPGMSNEPPHLGKTCYGIDLSNIEVLPRINLKYLLDFYQKYPDKDKFFIGSFDRLAGTPELKEQIKKGMSEEEIRATWTKGLEEYKQIRSKYLLYP
jgi:uncharacterized protein YbbC (DUF1343 family)